MTPFSPKPNVETCDWLWGGQGQRVHAHVSSNTEYFNFYYNFGGGGGGGGMTPFSPKGQGGRRGMAPSAPRTPMSVGGIVNSCYPRYGY